MGDDNQQGVQEGIEALDQRIVSKITSLSICGSKRCYVFHKGVWLNRSSCYVEPLAFPVCSHGMVGEVESMVIMMFSKEEAAEARELSGLSGDTGDERVGETAWMVNGDPIMIQRSKKWKLSKWEVRARLEYCRYE